MYKKLIIVAVLLLAGLFGQRSTPSTAASLSLDSTPNISVPPLIGAPSVTQGTMVLTCANVHTPALEAALAARGECGFTKQPDGDIVRPADSTGPIFGSCGLFELTMGNMGFNRMWWEIEITSWFLPIYSTSYQAEWYKLNGAGQGFIFDQAQVPWYNPFAMGFAWWSNKIIGTGPGYVKGLVYQAHEQLEGGESCYAPPGLQTQAYITFVRYDMPQWCPKRHHWGWKGEQCHEHELTENDPIPTGRLMWRSSRCR